MKVRVKMDAEDFMEFMEWKDEKDLYERKEASLRREMFGELKKLADFAIDAIDEIDENDEGGAATFKVKNQAAAAKLCAAAREVFD